MKKKLQSVCVCLAILLLTQMESMAQTRKDLIHYWNFNNADHWVMIVADTASPSTFKPITADYSVFDTSKVKIWYAAIPGTSSNFKTYFDTVAGDVINERPGYGGCCAKPNEALRLRNPSDSMQVLFYIPTTNYKDIIITYESESSSTGSGPHRQNFSYSLDSGTTFITTGLPMLYDSAGTTWPTKISGAVVLNLSAITTVNNTDKFVFRILQSAPNSGRSGNNRYDNITVEGTPTNCTAVTSPQSKNIPSGDSVVVGIHTYKTAGTYHDTLATKVKGCDSIIITTLTIITGITEYNLPTVNVYPNPTSGIINVTMGQVENAQINVYNILGDIVYQHIIASSNFQIDLSDQPKGIYFLQLKTAQGIVNKKIVISHY